MVFIVSQVSTFQSSWAGIKYNTNFLLDFIAVRNRFESTVNRFESTVIRDF